MPGDTYKLASYAGPDGSTRAGIVVDAQMVDVEQALRVAAALPVPTCSSVLSILERWDLFGARLRMLARRVREGALSSACASLSEVTLQPPVMYPSAIFCAGANYKDHVREMSRAMSLPEHPEVGPCTLNIGLIEGGRAPNVIPDHAKAQLLYRLVGPAQDLRRKIREAAGQLADVNFTLEIPFMKLQTLDGLPTMVAAFTTDIPALTNWGQPLLVGPGSIHVAHTEGEYVDKQALAEGVDLYCTIAKRLLS